MNVVNDYEVINNPNDVDSLSDLQLSPRFENAVNYDTMLATIIQSSLTSVVLYFLASQVTIKQSPLTILELDERR